MKYKLKELETCNFSFDKVIVENNKIINIKYKNDSLEFQTPKIIIDSLIKENNHEYLSLKIVGNKACESFCSKINQLETFFNTKKNWLDKNLPDNEIKSVFNEDSFIVKIPFKYSKPIIKVYKDNKLFNYYHLAKGMEIICLLSLSKIWVNFKNEISYNLNVKEILVI
jgi:hypothetical protein